MNPLSTRDEHWKPLSLPIPDVIQTSLDRQFKSLNGTLYGELHGALYRALR